MSTTTLHPLAADYLRRLRSATRALPADDRRELLAEVEAHLAEATHPGMSDAELRAVIDRLGSPLEIVRAQEADALAAEPRFGRGEWLTIALLPFGGLAFGVGWIVGLVMLWGSRVWSRGEKWLGTLVIPGGLAIPLWLLLLATRTGAHAQRCIGRGAGPLRCTPVAGPGTSWAGVVVAAVLLLASVAAIAWLARRARQTSAG